VTTNSKQQVVPGNDQQQSDPADAAPAAQQQPIEPEVVDIDAKDLADAHAAAEAEKALAGGDVSTQAPPGAPTKQAASAAPHGQQPPRQPWGGEAVMIPKARPDEIAGQRDQEHQNAANWRGVAESRNSSRPADLEGATRTHHAGAGHPRAGPACQCLASAPGPQ